MAWGLIGPKPLPKAPMTNYHSTNLRVMKSESNTKSLWKKMWQKISSALTWPCYFLSPCSKWCWALSGYAEGKKSMWQGWSELHWVAPVQWYFPGSAILNDVVSFMKMYLSLLTAEKETISIIGNSTVAVYCLAILGARTLINMIIKMFVSCVCTRPALEG